jgi:hypothetical protein
MAFMPTVPSVPPAGEEDADAIGMVRGQRPKQHVNRGTSPARCLKGGSDQMAIGNREGLVGRDDVDMVRFHAHAPAHLRHREGGMRLQDLRQVALVLGRQVDDHDEDHARAGRQRGKEGLECPDATGRSAEADDHRVVGVGRAGGTWCVVVRKRGRLGRLACVHAENLS